LSRDGLLRQPIPPFRFLVLGPPPDFVAEFLLAALFDIGAAAAFQTSVAVGLLDSLLGHDSPPTAFEVRINPSIGRVNQAVK
jgi:hypothetical protein